MSTLKTRNTCFCVNFDDFEQLALLKPSKACCKSNFLLRCSVEVLQRMGERDES